MVLMTEGRGDVGTLASFETVDGDPVVLRARGEWTLAGGLAAIDTRLRRFAASMRDRSLTIDLAGLDALDTSGAMVLQRVMQDCGGRVVDGAPLAGFENASEQNAQLLSQVAGHLGSCAPEPRGGPSFVVLLERLGRGAEAVWRDSLNILSFVGAVAARLGATLANPAKFRTVSLVAQMETAGLDATLIVGLMSFLIGAVVAFMGATVLAAFGAEIFAVELVGIAVLREFGVLLTAILVAGRSGSAFTAAIGSMKLREEVDAMRVMGIDPLDALVIPRTLALILTLPVLAFLAAFLGVLGGGLAAWLAMDIKPVVFLLRMQEEVPFENMWIGLVKAPFFAFVIAVVGCYHGMNVEASAEELGRRTTMAVVQSLFLVILLDAIFAMLFLDVGV